MNFHIDTSGAIHPVMVQGRSRDFRWPDLSPFTQGYIEALLTDLDHSKGVRDPLLPRAFFRNLAPETLARIIADCEAFGAAYGGEKRDAKTGAKLWRLRQDRWPGTDFKHAFPPLTVQLGDDGKVRFA